ncbi:DUF6463 family protein [Pendulispora albinea]|uniref:DUF6463 family protein n=1 Tax=Pendulispora albinea TaxID=2741071 RepID=A0ABZ2M5L8_9BACT
MSESLDRLVSARARTWTVWAGRSMIGIGILHVLYFTKKTWPYWAGWMGGDLRGLDVASRGASFSHEGFWALPGGFTATLVLLGLVAIRMAKAGFSLPGYVGWGLGAWAALCSVICEPSGFPLGLVPAVLLVAAHSRNRADATNAMLR